jgi:hypothetical protein
VGDHRRCDLRAGAVQIRDWVAVLGEQPRDLGLEGGDALVEVFDVAGEVADAAGRDLLDEAVTEADPLQPSQLALPGEVDDPRLADRIDLIPVGAEPLDRLRAVADEAAPLQLEQRQGADELGLERWSKLGALAEYDLRNGDRVAGVGLAWPMPTTLSMRAPGRDVEHLVPCGLERSDKEPAVAGRAFDTNDRLASIVGDEPLLKLSHPGWAVGEAERPELAAALVQQRSDMRALVHIDPDDHRGPPVSRIESRTGPARDASVSVQPLRRETPIKSPSPARPLPAGRRIERRSAEATITARPRHAFCLSQTDGSEQPRRPTGRQRDPDTQTLPLVCGR